MALSKIKNKINTWLYPLDHFVVEVDSIDELLKYFDWHREPLITNDFVYQYNSIEDINERKLRDAETVAAVCRNIGPDNILEIGTSKGMGTKLIAENANDSTVFTINILPDEIESGKGGSKTTWALAKEEIGIEYRKAGLDNVKQIFANTKSWEPDIGEIGAAYIDGCHDKDFVYSDTIKALSIMKKGGVIMWHDFNPKLQRKYHWVGSVCQGIKKLIRRGKIKGPILYVKNSWVGVYQVK